MNLTVYGVNTLKEAILSNNLKRGDEIYISEKKRKNGKIDKDLIKLLKDKNINIVTKNDSTFMKYFGKEALTKGIAANVEYTEKIYEKLFDGASAGSPSQSMPLYLILDEITDPQNLGSIIRTANCVGISGIILPKSNSVFITPSVAYVSQGALFYVNMTRVVNISRTIRDLKERGILVVGLSNESEDTIYKMDYNVPVAIVIGSEGRGLRRLTVEKCEKVLKIPMAGNINSLNASVSFAVIAYEIIRQRKTD